jgi:uncharacterized protein
MSASPIGAVKVFQQDNYAVLFSRDDLTLRLLDLEHGELSGASGAPESLSELANTLLPPAAEPQASSPPSPGEQPPDSRPSLDRLTLTVANTCNLSCSYCYAAQGTYYNKPGLMMSKETAMNSINQAARAYSRIEHINFFGGEPTLNRDIIELTCEYVRYLNAQGVMTYMPTFGITTNGYALSERMLEVLITYGFSVTLSLDGPQQIHDAKRPTSSGGGSYDQVVANIRTLLANGLDVEFECTYTADHLRQGIDLVALMDFFATEFGCRVLHCPIVAANPDSAEAIPLDKALELQGNALEASILNLARGIPKATSLATRMLASLTSQTPIWNYCPAGRKEVTVNADGKVYACFMLMQTPEYSFGSVNPKLDRDSSKPRVSLARRSLPLVDSRGPGARKGQIEQFIGAADKYTNPACQRCWAQPLCHGCLGEDFDRSAGKPVPRSEIPGESEFCDYKRGIVEQFLRSLAKAYQIQPPSRAATPAPTADHSCR